MTRRTTIIFWSATAAAVALLGGTVATLKALLAGGSRINLALLALSLGGLLGSLLAAGRIAVVVGRTSRPDHPPTASQERGPGPSHPGHRAGAFMQDFLR